MIVMQNTSQLERGGHDVLLAICFNYLAESWKQVRDVAGESLTKR